MPSGLLLPTQLRPGELPPGTAWHELLCHDLDRGVTQNAAYDPKKAVPKGAFLDRRSNRALLLSCRPTPPSQTGLLWGSGIQQLPALLARVISLRLPAPRQHKLPPALQRAVPKGCRASAGQNGPQPPHALHQLHHQPKPHKNLSPTCPQLFFPLFPWVLSPGAFGWRPDFS